MLRICVAGSVVKDRVRTFSGNEFESFGGILYNVLGFFLGSGGGICVVPVFHAGPDDLERIKAGFEGLNGIDWRFVRVCQMTDENVIVYRNPQEREERYKKNSPPVMYSDLMDPLNSSDAVLLNFIREDDFPDVFERLCSFGGKVYVDLHKRAFYMDSSFAFLLSRSVDILQCNHNEYEALMKVTTLESLFSERLSLLVVTMGKRGASFCGRELAFRFFPAPQVKEKDPTGAGDVFGAVFLRRYMETGDPMESLSEAVRVASLSVSMEGLEGFK